MSDIYYEPDVTYTFDNITPTDVKVYIEDGVPYLDYKGIIKSGKQDVEIHIPKMGLNFRGVECGSDRFNNGYILTSLRHQCFAINEPERPYMYTLKILEREMTKKEIEKELGYKVNIVD